MDTGAFAIACVSQLSRYSEYCALTTLKRKSNMKCMWTVVARARVCADVISCVCQRWVDSVSQSNCVGAHARPLTCTYHTRTRCVYAKSMQKMEEVNINQHSTREHLVHCT